VQAIGVESVTLERVDPDRTTTVIASLNASGFQIGSKWPIDNGGLAALAALLVRPLDGLTIMHASAEAAIISQMLARPGVTWDVAKLNWLAKTSMAPKLWYVGANARYPTIKDAERADPLTWSATGPADNISDVAAIISYVLGLKSKVVTGYRGAGDMSLAVMRNEVDSGILSADTALPHVLNRAIKPVPSSARSGGIIYRTCLP